MTAFKIETLGFAKLLEGTAAFAMRVRFGGGTDSPPAATAFSEEPIFEPDSEPIEINGSVTIAIERAKQLFAEPEIRGDSDKRRRFDEVVSLLEPLVGNDNPSDDGDQHRVLYYLALVLCRRVEMEVSSGAKESLLQLHLTLSRVLFLLRRAVDASPPSLKTKIEYCALIGNTATLWSTTLSSSWPPHQVLELLGHLKAEAATADPLVDRLTGFVWAIVMASTLSTAYGVTQDNSYRQEGRNMYRNTLSSMREILPLDTLINPISTMDFMSKLRALGFIKDGVIPFIMQVMAVLMQKLVEVPLSSVVGRRAAALAMEKGFSQQGVEWLEQCLMLVWGQLNLRAPAPMETMRIKGARAESQERMESIILAFLGVCVYVDVAGDGGETIAQPERLAYLLFEEWLKAGNELRSDPIYKDLFQPYSFKHIAQAAQHNPVVMISLWGPQCDALILLDVEHTKSIRLEGMTEGLAATLQSKFRGGLQTDHFRSRGDEASDERGTMAAPNIPDIQKVLSILWKTVVKPLFDAMGLQPIDNPRLDPPRLTWCPTGPTSFFPLHAAGLYDTQDKGTKSYEYVASSYIPTLSILANANVALSQEEERPFKGILAVSQPNEGGQVEIEKTVDEVRDLISIVGDAAHLQWLNGKEATKEKVLAAMGSSTWVHLACHARQYPLNTSESAFLLDSGESLSLADISENASAEGELAFLSACQTAAGDFDLSEEGVHLAAGMLVAGYRSVIATAWSVRDKDAPEVAKEVYRRLLKDGKVDRTGAGLALHHATRLLRESVGEDQFMRWASFIHLGV